MLGLFCPASLGWGNDLMKIIHLSDIHLTLPGDLVEGLDPLERLKQAFSHIKTHHADAERVVITGDLTHWGEPEAYKSLAETVNQSGLPIRLLIGNHDHRVNFLDCLPDQPRDENNFVNYSETQSGFTLIYCDTNKPLTHAGHFCEPRQAWLKTQIDNAPGDCLLFMHHNPGRIHLPATDSIALVTEDAVALEALLYARKDKVRHLFFGHTHMTLSGTFARIPYSGVRSTVHQSIPVFNDPDWLHGGELSPYYAVAIMNTNDSVIHQIPFLYDGKIRQSGTAWDDWAKEG